MIAGSSLSSPNLNAAYYSTLKFRILAYIDKKQLLDQGHKSGLCLIYLNDFLTKELVTTFGLFVNLDWVSL
jgi:hypothetical protein